MTTSSNPFLAAVHELGPKFAERAPALDKSGEFPAENYRELKAKKLFSAGVPKDLGGGGATHAELCEVIRELAHYCPSTALALSMHTHLVAAAVWRHLHGQPAAPLLQKVSEAERVLVSTGAADWLDSVGTVKRVDGGYSVTAQKRFASGSPAGDLIMTSAPYDDPAEGPQVLHFAVPMSAPGVSSLGDWDTLGMRATGSHTVAFENVFVPDASIAVKRPRGPWHPSFNVICVIALPLVMSAYVGVAEKAALLAREAAKKRLSDPHLPYLLGEMENALLTAQIVLRDGIHAAAGYDFPPEMERGNAALMRKTIIAEAVLLGVKKAVESTRGSAFYRKNPLEKLFRDAQGVHYHPLPQKKQLLVSGRIAMGLPPV